MRILALSGLLLLGLLQGETAPDGHRGLGAETSARDLQKLLRSDAEEDTAFVAHLFGLTHELRVLVGMVETGYRDAGYFDGFELTERDLFRLHDAFYARLDTARESLEAGEGFPPEMARLWADVSFVLRSELLLEFPTDAAELSGGLALIVAHGQGFADLRPFEVEGITRRVDLAAARLRAVQLDLVSLLETESWQQTAEEEERALLALAAEADPDRRLQEFRRIEDALKQRFERARSALNLPRLEPGTRVALSDRWRRIDEGLHALARVRVLVPDTPEGAEAPEDVRALSKSERYGAALREALDALGHDPLNAELCYFAGLSADFLHGPRESLRWFDRFLALRRIRGHDDRTYRHKRLTAEEQHALNVVQRGR